MSEVSNGKSKEKGGKKIIGSVIAVILIILVAVGIIFFIFVMPGYLTPKQAIENYLKAISYEDVNLYKDSCYTGKWSKGYKDASASGKDIDSTIANSFTMQSGAVYSDVKIISQQTMEDDYKARMIEIVELLYGVRINVSKIVKVDFSVKYSFGDNTNQTGKLTRYCYKCDGKWFFLADNDVIIGAYLEE